METCQPLKAFGTCQCLQCTFKIGVTTGEHRARRAPLSIFLFILKWIADKKNKYFILKNYKCSIQTLQSTVRSVYYSVLHFIHSSNFSGNEVISGDIDSKPVASKTGMRKDACELSFFQI